MRRSAFVCLMLAVGAVLAAQAPKAAPPKAMRLYVLDCGLLNITREGVERYHVTTAEVGETRMPVPCFLVAHPKGTLMWDMGVIPDDDVEKAAAGGARYDVNPTAAAVVSRTLRSQLAAIGYRPADITYVAISHAHKDHTANLNQFAASTWLTPKAERDFMWKPNNERVEPRFFSALEKSKWVPLDKDEYDVFGDGAHLLFSSAEKNRGSTRSLFGFHMNSRSARGVSHVAPANWFKLAVWSLCACEMAT